MFNALCENAKAQAANFPFCTIEPNVGIVAVPDSRLDELRWVLRAGGVRVLWWW
jgi:ribosome-binding ATPase YchF (GTP1/OBG family)